MITLFSPEWEISAIEAIFFDKDGTLIDSHLYWGRIIERRSQALISEFKLKDAIYPELCRCMGFSLKTRRLLPEGPIALVSRQEVIKIVLDFLAKQNVTATFEQVDELFIRVHSDFLQEIHEYVKILPGAERFLKKLKDSKIKTAVITTDSMKNTEEIMSLLGIGKYFDLLLGKEATPFPKTSGKPALIALEKLKVNNSNSIAIGDSPMDIKMARNAGLKAGIAVALGQVSFEDLKKETEYVACGYEELRIA